jgi:hypothetical protein
MKCIGKSFISGGKTATLQTLHQSAVLRTGTLMGADTPTSTLVSPQAYQQCGTIESEINCR